MKTFLMEWLRRMPERSGVVAGQACYPEMEELIRDAALHGLSAVLERALANDGVVLHQPHRDQLRRDALATVATSLRVKALLARTCTELGRRGVVPVLLKGPALAFRLYGDALIRQTTDVDLLLDAADVEPAVEVLREMGLRLSEDAENYYPPKYRHHYSYKDTSGLVEIHFRAMSAFGTLVEADAWLERTRRWSFEGLPVRLLSPEDELVFLSLHAASHMFQRITWLYDLKLFLALHPALDWASLVTVARATRLPNQVYFALDVTRRMLDANLPDGALDSLIPTLSRRIAGRWFYRRDKLSASALQHDKRAWVVAKFLMADSRTRLALFLGRRATWSIQRAFGSRVH